MKLKNKTRRKIRKQRKSRKIKGGTKINIQEFVDKLRAMIPFIEDLIARGAPDDAIVTEIYSRFGESLHAKCARVDYPTVQEHLHNMKTFLSLFDSKYEDSTHLQRDSMQHQDMEMFPAGGCLDAKITWLSGFLIGPDKDITPHNKNAKISAVISTKFKELSAFLKSRPSRYEYEQPCNRQRVLETIIRHPSINTAIQK